MIEAVILGHAADAQAVGSNPSGAGCIVIHHGHPLVMRSRSLRAAMSDAADGDWVVYAIALDQPWLARLLLLAAIRFHVRRAAAIISRAGGRVVGRYGVDPSLATPACIYELDSAAAVYADRCLRPRGASATLRRLLTRCSGYDPALGGVVVLGRKTCSPK